MSGEMPVASTLAERRAQVCYPNKEGKCPKNESPSAFEELVGHAASMAKLAFEWKAKRSLIVSNEVNLGICDACTCDLPFKVWTPIDQVLKDLKPEEEAELDPRCWILKEKKERNQNV